MHKKLFTAGTALVSIAYASTAALAAEPGVPSMGGGAAGGGGKRVGISASTEVRYDSNFSHTSSASVAGPQSEERLIPQLNLDLGLPFGAHSFSIAGGIGYDFHRHNKKLDKENINLNSGLTLNISPCTPSFSGNIQRRQSDLGEIAPTAGTGINSVKNAQTEWQIGGNLSCGKSFGLRPTAGITYEEGHNSATLRQINNRHALTYMVGLNYVHPSIGDIQLFAQQRELRFDNQILLNGQENGNRTRSYGISFSRAIGARLQGNASVSWTNLNPRQPGLRNFKGLNWSGSLTLQATPLLTLDAGISKSTSSTLAVASNFSVSTGYNFSANYTLTPRIALQAGFTTKKKSYQGLLIAPPTGVPPLTGDRKQAISGSISYTMSPKLQFSLNAARESRDASGTFYDYHNNRVALQASLSL